MWGGIAALAALGVVLVWLLAGRHTAPHEQTPGSEERDYESLEAAAELREAEEEVRNLDASAQPGDEQPGDDWGPGTSRPRVPS
ncbi:MAG: hypothetical protein ABI613_08480 [Gemmatimonadota bacterium]